MIPSIMSGSLIRETPPSARMSAGTRSSAMTATAPASSAIFACSAVTTSMMTPPFSISAMPRFTRSVPVAAPLSAMAFVLTLGPEPGRWSCVHGRGGPTASQTVPTGQSPSPNRAVRPQSYRTPKPVGGRSSISKVCGSVELPASRNHPTSRWRRTSRFARTPSLRNRRLIATRRVTVSSSSANSSPPGTARIAATSSGVGEQGAQHRGQVALRRCPRRRTVAAGRRGPRARRRRGPPTTPGRARRSRRARWPPTPPQQLGLQRVPRGLHPLVQPVQAAGGGAEVPRAQEQRAQHDDDGRASTQSFSALLGWPSGPRTGRADPRSPSPRWTSRTRRRPGSPL